MRLFFEVSVTFMYERCDKVMFKFFERCFVTPYMKMLKIAYITLFVQNLKSLLCMKLIES